MQRSSGEFEHRERELATGASACRPPPKSAGDHQVDHDKEIVFQPEDDTLSHAPQLDDSFALDGSGRWIDRAEYKRISNKEAVQRLAEHAGTQLPEIERDVGKLWHNSA